jgi:glycosyltransferase involved in cell wall biosynthesis
VIEEELSEAYDVVIVVPTLNEEKGISPTLNAIKESLEGKLRFKVLVVDGLSTDRTVEIAKSMGAKVIKQRRRGYGDALQAGFYFVDTKMKASVIVMMDSDGTYDPKDIVNMVNIINNGEADFVIGNRFAKMDNKAMTATNRVGNKILSAIARKLLNMKITDTQCGIRAFKSDLTSIFYNTSIGMPFATEMLALAHQYYIKIKEIPVSYHERIGETKLSPLQDGSKILGTTIRLMRDTRPLSFFCSIGAIMIILGTLLGVGVLLEYLTTGTIRRIPTTILSVLLVVLGVQTISLGLISDMIKNKNNDKRIFYSE